MLSEADQEGKLKALVEASFLLEKAAKAHALGDTNRVTGKLVLAVP
ncbi:zinc-binding dehydrogenase [Streptomyces sp. NPDC049577]